MQCEIWYDPRVYSGVGSEILAKETVSLEHGFLPERLSREVKHGLWGGAGVVNSDIIKVLSREASNFWDT